ncbi:MAG: hypothetical protein HQK78_19010 [Desulfobacterales bacterium]|nr:hypothetical protein [Desulfobacterales bacterium]
MQTATQRQPFKMTPVIKKAIIKVIDDRIKERHVTKEDFSELKEIMRDLAKEQVGVKKALAELAAESKETKKAVAELAAESKETKKAVAELAAEMQGLAKGLKENRSETGGLSRSMSYALENEAFRVIPKVLKEKYSIEITEKFIREEISGKEINIFGKGKKNGEEVIIVGEAKLRLDERRIRKGEDDNIFTELKDHIEVVQKEYPNIKIIKLFITHYATKGFLKKAKEEDIIVIQSFEW